MKKNKFKIGDVVNVDTYGCLYRIGVITDMEETGDEEFDYCVFFPYEEDNGPDWGFYNKDLKKFEINIWDIVEEKLAVKGIKVEHREEE